MPGNHVNPLIEFLANLVARFWRGVLVSPPLFNAALQKSAVKRLFSAACRGNNAAAVVLATSLDINLPQTVIQEMKNLLTGVYESSRWDPYWQVWLEQRGPRLGALLSHVQIPTAKPDQNRWVSLLKLGLIAQIEERPEAIHVLVDHLEDTDKDIAGSAESFLRALKKRPAINAFCAHWSRSRSLPLTKILEDSLYIATQPVEVRILTTLKNNQLVNILNSPAALVPILITAAGDAEPQIASRALAVLLTLQQPDAVHTFCQTWLQTRTQILTDILTKASYIDPQPGIERIFTALINNRMEIACAATPQDLPHLLVACEDEDPRIRQSALRAAANLLHPQTIAALCGKVMETESPLLNDIVREGGYLPNRPDQQALVLFLTGQWARYDSLDFDQRLMRVVYATAKSELRQRIVHQVQDIGRTAYLSILMETNMTSQRFSLDKSEISLLIEVLTNNQEWPRLWELCPNLPWPHSLETLRILTQQDWHPEPGVEADLFRQIQARLNQPVLTNLQTPGIDFPPAIASEVLRVRGRVNSVAFSPCQPWLAIGTGEGKVAIWNYHRGEMEQILRGFAHSIGPVLFTPNGDLIISQRANSSTTCRIYLDQGGQLNVIGKHTGSITSLHVLDRTMVLSTGRDGYICLWDIPSRQLIASALLPSWPRSIAIAPRQNQAVLLGKRIQMVQLPNLLPLQDNFARSTKGFVDQSIYHCSIFTPDGKTILVGQFNGQIVAFQPSKNRNFEWKGQLLSDLKSDVVSLQFLSGHSRSFLVAACKDHAPRFLFWPEQSLVPWENPEDGTFTSLDISPDGSFIATGTNKSMVTLWDTRVLDLPEIMVLPLDQITPGQLAALIGLTKSGKLPHALQNTVEIIRLLLEHRFRYDIQVADLPVVEIGKFDIILE